MNSKTTRKGAERNCHVCDHDYVLIGAPERDFGINYAVYRNDPEFDEFLDYGADLEGLNCCFWIERRGQRIGGIVLKPNHIEGLFLRPPHVNAFEVLEAIMPLLHSWSDEMQSIKAQDVSPVELELYQRLGFRFAGSRRVYIRPTESFHVQWEDDYRIASPGREHVAQVSALFNVAYRGYANEWSLSSYGLDDWICRTEKRLCGVNLPEVCNQASTFVYDRAGERLVGACIVRLSRSIVRPDTQYAKVADIAVHPVCRRRGIASRMLQKALSVLHGKFPVLTFGVAVGNPAEAFYYNMGFLPGPVQHKLEMPALTQQVHKEAANDQV